MPSDKTSSNQTMLLNRPGPSRGSSRGNSGPSRGTRLLRTSLIVLLALSPFLAYVLFLPPEDQSAVTLEPTSSPPAAATPSPLTTTPAPFLAAPEPTEEPLLLDPATNSATDTSTPAKRPAAKPRPKPAAKVAAQPAPAPAPAPEPPPSEDPPADQQGDSDPDPPIPDDDDDVDDGQSGAPVSCDELPVPDCQ